MLGLGGCGGPPMDAGPVPPIALAEPPPPVPLPARAETVEPIRGYANIAGVSPDGQLVVYTQQWPRQWELVNAATGEVWLLPEKVQGDAVKWLGPRQGRLGVGADRPRIQAHPTELLGGYPGPL